MSVDESILCLPSSSGPEPFSNGRLSFIAQEDAYTGVEDPDRWVQRGCIVYCAEGINGATVVENLSPDTLHRPVDFLTEEWIHLSRRRGAR